MRERRESREEQNRREYHAEMQRLRGIQGGAGKVERLTVTEVARTLLEHRGPRAASGSVTLTWNAKGDTQIEVTVPTSDELPTIEQAGEAAQAVYDALRGRYPRGQV